MKQQVEIDFSSHYISKFNIENMEILHGKIRSTYPIRKHQQVFIAYIHDTFHRFTIFQVELIKLILRSFIMSYKQFDLSKFNIENMEILHGKIRSTYPNLDELTKKEFDKLYELTNGNIIKIKGSFIRIFDIRIM